MLRNGYRPYHLGSDRRQGRRRAAGPERRPRRSASIPRSAGSSRSRPSPGSCPGGPSIRASGPGAPNSPLAPPFPDLLVASGRRAVAYLRFVKKASGGRTYHGLPQGPPHRPEDRRLHLVAGLRPPARPERAQHPDPAAPGLGADGSQRRAAGPILASPTCPTPASRCWPAATAAITASREADIARFVEHLTAVAEAGAGLMVTASRRTPPALRDGSRRARRPAWRLLLGRHGREPLCRPARSRRFRRRDGGFLQHDRRGRRDGTADPGVRALRRTPETGCLHGGPESPWNCASVRGAS